MDCVAGRFGVDPRLGPHHHQVVKANSELSFRVSLIRSTLHVDVCRSSQSLTTVHQHLQAEMEQQARLRVTQTQATGTGAPGVRAVTPVDALTTKGPLGACGARGKGASARQYVPLGVCWRRAHGRRNASPVVPQLTKLKDCRSWRRSSQEVSNEIVGCRSRRNRFYIP